MPDSYVRRAGRRWVGLALAGLCSACNPAAPKTAATAQPSAARPTPLALHVTGHGTPSRPVRSSLRIHNRTEYELIARSFESRGGQGTTTVDFQDARVTFYDPHGTTTVANAPVAIVDQRTGLVTMTGGVRASTSTGITLQSDQLVYDHHAGTLHGTGNVVVTNPQGFRGTGSRFDADIALSAVRLQ